MELQQLRKNFFFNLRKIKNQLTSIDSGNLSPENVREIATRLDVKEGEVVDMENRLFTSDQSLNVKMGEENDTEWQDLIEDKQETHDKIIENKDELDYRRNLFLEAFKILNDREKEIIKLRKLRETPLKLEDLSKKYKISRERVRQIEEKALEKLQKEISNIR